MAAIAISETSLASVKKELRADFIEEKSAHLTEALASALGFNTHAALLAVVAREAEDPPIVLLNSERFVSRLQDFGYPRDDEFDFEFFTGRSKEVISTVPVSAFEYPYTATRHKAWRNILVCAINEALRLKLFSFRPGDNRWRGARPVTKDGPDYRVSDPGGSFEFTLPNGMPARGHLHDAGFDELTVSVAVLPKGDKSGSVYIDFSSGEACAQTWLERRNGAYMQSALTLFKCRKALLVPLSEMEIVPLGYGDRGRVIM